MRDDLKGWIRRALGPALLLGALLGVGHTTSAQFGHPLFAFVEIPILDNSGRPLVNGETGERITNGLCLAWPSTATQERRVEKVTDSLLTSVAYTVDVPRRTVVIDKVRMVNTIATPETIPLGARGWMLAGPPDEVTLSVNLTGRLFDRPQPGWKCTDDNWRRALAGFRYTPPSPSAGDDSLADSYRDDSARSWRRYFCKRDGREPCE